jgi:hypothetical protein
MVVALPHKRLDAATAPTVPFFLKSFGAFFRRVILRLQGDTMPRHQFTIFAEDAQEYTAAFTSSRRHLGKQKMRTSSLDHNKKYRKKPKNVFGNASRRPYLLERARTSRSQAAEGSIRNPAGILSATCLGAGKRVHFQCGPAVGPAVKGETRISGHG